MSLFLISIEHIRIVTIHCQNSEIFVEKLLVLSFSYCWFNQTILTQWQCFWRENNKHNQSIKSTDDIAAVAVSESVVESNIYQQQVVFCHKLFHVEFSTVAHVHFLSRNIIVEFGSFFLCNIYWNQIQVHLVNCAILQHTVKTSSEVLHFEK